MIIDFRRTHDAAHHCPTCTCEPVTTPVNVEHYANAQRFKNSRVFVDGVEVPGVFYVDTDEGVVRFYKRDETNRYFTDAHGEAVTDEVRGRVELQPLVL